MIYFTPEWKGTLNERQGIITGAYHKPSKWILHNIQSGKPWIVDNGMFANKFNEDSMLNFLSRFSPYRDTCKFVVALDVMSDARATLKQFDRYACPIRALGYPVAYVAQDGAECLPFPDKFDALFVGGSTEWKLGHGAEKCILRAHALGKWTHVGRVNSHRRFKHFLSLGVDSCDGTYYVYGPNMHMKKITDWVQTQSLFAKENL